MRAALGSSDCLSLRDAWTKVTFENKDSDLDMFGDTLLVVDPSIELTGSPTLQMTLSCQASLEIVGEAEEPRVSTFRLRILSGRKLQHPR